MNLYQALRLQNQSRIAFVGAGGKTTAMFQLAHLFGPPVVVTTSTHLGTWQANFADRHFMIERPEDMDRFSGQIEGVTLFTGPAEANDRFRGLTLEMLMALNDLAKRLGFPILVEADGSRQLPLKAPAAFEPVIPGWVDTVLVVAGLSGIGKKLDHTTVHRPEQFAQLCEGKIGDQINGDTLAKVLNHPEGGLKSIPPMAKKVVLLNQADNLELIAEGLYIAGRLIRAYDTVLIASLNEKVIWERVEPAAGILLAGGQSSRFGMPKMLLEWRGMPVIRHVAETALAAGVNPLVVVTGAVDDAIRVVLRDLPVMMVANPDWQIGQSTSVKQGLRALPENTGAAIFLLADQPFVTAELIQALIRKHESSGSPIIAPRVDGRRANPVLFDRVTFGDLLALEGDTGGRAVFGKYPVDYVDWQDANLLFDIDTPEDYDRLRGLA